MAPAQERHDVLSCREGEDVVEMQFAREKTGSKLIGFEHQLLILIHQLFDFRIQLVDTIVEGTKLA